MSLLVGGLQRWPRKLRSVGSGVNGLAPDCTAAIVRAPWSYFARSSNRILIAMHVLTGTPDPVDRLRRIIIRARRTCPDRRVG
jgi:hypothetical protein